MKKEKIQQEFKAPSPMDPELLDGFVVAIIDALKKVKDPYAVAEVKDLMITTPLEELLLFVGITSKQSGTTALFAWTEAVNTSDTSTKGLLNEKADEEENSN